MKAIILVTLTLFSISAMAASRRILSCKGASTTPHFKTFRVNVLETATGERKATVSEGFTTMNTSSTWLVNIIEVGTTMSVVNGNKADFHLLINKREDLTIDDVAGMHAVANIEFEGAPGKMIKISNAVMACRFEN